MKGKANQQLSKCSQRQQILCGRASALAPMLEGDCCKMVASSGGKQNGLRFQTVHDGSLPKMLEVAHQHSSSALPQNIRSIMLSLRGRNNTRGTLTSWASRPCPACLPLEVPASPDCALWQAQLPWTTTS